MIDIMLKFDHKNPMVQVSNDKHLKETDYHQTKLKLNLNFPYHNLNNWCKLLYINCSLNMGMYSICDNFCPSDSLGCIKYFLTGE